MIGVYLINVTKDNFLNSVMLEDFANDATITSAVLDRLLHHAETIIVEGKSYRMKDRIDEP